MDSFDSFDVRIQPISFDEFQRRLLVLEISAGEPVDGVCTFRRHGGGFRMGIGTNFYYSCAFRGPDESVSPPTIEAFLGYFDITVEEWVAASEQDREVAE